MGVLNYFSSLNPVNLLSAIPGNFAQGVIWGIMALGVFITFRLLDFPDLTVDGSFAVGGAVTVVLIMAGVPAPIALVVAVVGGLLAGFVTGLLHTVLGIPGILAGILTQISLWSANLLILSGANKAVNVDKYSLIVSSQRDKLYYYHPYLCSDFGLCFVLVLRHGTRQCHSRHRQQPANGSSAGHQY